jgi:hypothetical protein
MNSSDINSVIQAYLGACSESDTEMFEEVFHNAAHLYCYAEGGVLKLMDKQEFIGMVKSRKAEGPKPEFPRHEEVLSLDYACENTAVARVKVRVGSILFSDILGLIRFDGKWSIISKLYSGAPAE